MKRVLISLVSVGIVIAALCLGVLFLRGTKVPANGFAMVATIPNPQQWVETFGDDFIGGQLNRAKWVTCYDWRQPTESGCTNGGNFEQEWYEPTQVSVAFGHATLTAVRDPVTVVSAHGVSTYLYRSGMISTGRPDSTQPVRWSGTYGYYEARLKFDGGQGVWPAFWLLPIDSSWPPEIDAMEFLGSNRNEVLQTLHWKDQNGQPQKDASYIPGPDYTSGWHTYAINWQPGKVDWYIDGKVTKSINSGNIPNVPMEIIINLAIGGTLPGDAVPSTPFPRTMQIDYVKVYELKK